MDGLLNCSAESSLCLSGSVWPVGLFIYLFIFGMFQCLCLFPLLTIEINTLVQTGLLGDRRKDAQTMSKGRWCWGHLSHNPAVQMGTNNSEIGTWNIQHCSSGDGMLFRWEGFFCLFLFSSHHLCVSTAAKRDRAQSRAFAHGCQPGVICYGRKKRFPSESWEMQPGGRGRGLVDAGRTQLPRETARSFQPTEPVLAPVTSVSVSAHSREESAASKLLGRQTEPWHLINTSSRLSWKKTAGGVGGVRGMMVFL